MYCVVSWDISAVNPRWSKIDEQLRDCLKAYNWYRPVNTFYMIKVTGSSQVATIQSCLTTAAKAVTESVQFVISPAFAAGRWNGLLGDGEWAKVNAITD